MFEFLIGLFLRKPAKARRPAAPKRPALAKAQRPPAPPKPPKPQKENPKAAKERELIALWRANPIRLLPPSPADVALGEPDNPGWATEADALFSQHSNGLGRNALMQSAERARKAGALLPALRRHMAVVYIDLNDPRNAVAFNGEPQLAAAYPPFTAADASQIAPKQFEWLIDCAEGLALDHKGLRKEFLIASRSIWTPALPLSPEKAWRVVDGYIQGEQPQ